MNTNNNSPQTKMHFALDLRWIVAALLIVIALMLATWRPWQGTTSDDQTIQVTGETTLTAVPDEFVFYPTYQFESSDNTAALNALAKKSEEVTAKLKELGVPDNKIKTNSSGYHS
ncbi:MAG: SIMPL domain-containing protein [Candidatus Saccharimonadales bacterium]